MKYELIVEYSNEDGAFLGRCPQLFDGGCHGESEKETMLELIQIVTDQINEGATSATQ